LATANESEKLSQLLSNLHSFQADFSQKMFVQNADDSELMTGVILIKKPGKFIWQVNAPFEQLLVADGKSLWQYDVDLEQVVVRDMNSTIGSTPVELLSGTVTHLEKRFSIKSEVKKKGTSNEVTVVYHLYPKDDAQFQFVDLVFSGEKLKELVLVDSLEQKTQVKFSNIKTNQPIDDSQFVFKLPDNVELIDSRIKSKNSRDESTQSPQQALPLPVTKND